MSFDAVDVDLSKLFEDGWLRSTASGQVPTIAESTRKTVEYMLSKNGKLSGTTFVFVDPGAAGGFVLVAKVNGETIDLFVVNIDKHVRRFLIDGDRQHLHKGAGRRRRANLAAYHAGLLNILAQQQQQQQQQEESESVSNEDDRGTWSQLDARLARRHLRPAAARRWRVAVRGDGHQSQLRRLHRIAQGRQGEHRQVLVHGRDHQAQRPGVASARAAARAAAQAAAQAQAALSRRAVSARVEHRTVDRRFEGDQAQRDCHQLAGRQL
jgi:hypothetical protein